MQFPLASITVSPDWQYIENIIGFVIGLVGFLRFIIPIIRRAINKRREAISLEIEPGQRLSFQDLYVASTNKLLSMARERDDAIEQRDAALSDLALERAAHRGHQKEWERDRSVLIRAIEELKLS